jgi:hypothetical protein
VERDRVSELDPEKPDPQQSRWVKSNILGEEPGNGDPVPAEEQPPQPPVPPLTEGELAAARWFSIAFLVIVIPLGFIVLALIVVAAIRSIQ